MLSPQKIFSIISLGNAIENKIIQLPDRGKMKDLHELVAKTPEEIIKIIKIKGIGSKKISIIWKEIGD